MNSEIQKYLHQVQKKDTLNYLNQLQSLVVDKSNHMGVDVAICTKDPRAQ